VLSPDDIWRVTTCTALACLSGGSLASCGRRATRFGLRSTPLTAPPGVTTLAWASVPE
jgi:hypothetical protein